MNKSGGYVCDWRPSFQLETAWTAWRFRLNIIISTLVLAFFVFYWFTQSLRTTVPLNRGLWLAFSGRRPFLSPPPMTLLWMPCGYKPNALSNEPRLHYYRLVGGVCLTVWRKSSRKWRKFLKGITWPLKVLPIEKTSSQFFSYKNIK